jgi:3-oxoacyl-[acyl-carrier protein] reductase
MNELNFDGKVVLVVGGSSGIGNGIAQSFAARGADVHVWGTRPTAADYADEVGSDLSGLQYTCVDVADADAVEAAIPTFTKLDVLVQCQGTVLYKRQEFERDGWDKVIGINLTSLMSCARKFHPALMESNGSMILTSSVSGYIAARGNPAYAASKSGVIGLVRTLGEAWAPDGIRVNGIAPGFVETKITAVTFDNPKRREATVAAIPVRRIGTPDEMAGTALFLASPLASYIIGQTIIVDGGLSLS